MKLVKELIFAIIIAFLIFVVINISIAINTFNYDEYSIYNDTSEEENWQVYFVYFMAAYIPYFIAKFLYAIFKLIVNRKLEWSNNKFFKYIPFLFILAFSALFIIFPLIYGYE